ncbi:MAG: formylglycine-generating enzyme family protein [Candidatus Xenobiia bacterium LiM19]
MNRRALYCALAGALTFMVFASSAAFSGPTRMIYLVRNSSDTSSKTIMDTLEKRLQAMSAGGEFKGVPGLRDGTGVYDMSCERHIVACYKLGIKADTVPAIAVLALDDSGTAVLRLWLIKVTTADNAIERLLSHLGKPLPRNTPVCSPEGERPKTVINQKDGSEMVLIPAGEFMMGSREEKSARDDCPGHTVYIDEYCIGKYEVTNDQFSSFVKDSHYVTDAEKAGDQRTWRTLAVPGRDTHPVACVTWNDAKAYCEWAGGNLPSEAQWEKAARGTDGRAYPWGNEWDEKACNWFEGPSASGLADIFCWRGTAPAGSFPAGANPCGVEDMAGNVWEWCSDWYGESFYRESPSRNPGGPAKGDYRIVRGGSWSDYSTRYFQCACRHQAEPGGWSANIGFRFCRISGRQQRD